MRTKHIVIAILILVVLAVASAPIGQIFVDLGNGLVSVGHQIEGINPHHG